MFRERRAWEYIYEYYVSKGLFIYILDNIVSLIIGVSISIAPVILFGCCDFSKMSTVKSISDIIVPFREGLRRCSLFVLTCSFVFLVFNLLKFIQFVVALRRFVQIHKYFQGLGITDHDLSVVRWNEVVESILIHESSERKSALSIVQDILRFDNYLCAMVSDPSILTWKLPWMNKSQTIPMTRFFFYLLRLSLSGIVLDTNGASLVNGLETIRSPATIKRLKTRFRIIGVCLTIFSPFVLCFEILFLLFHYLQAVRNSPETLSLRRWTPHAKWMIREYNELPHLLGERISHSYKYANFYMDLFPTTWMQLIFKILAFFSGSLLTILFVLGIFTDSGYFFTIDVFAGKSLAWLMSVLASIYGVCKVSIASEVHLYTADECMEKMERYIHFDFRDSKSSAQSWEAYDKFSHFFQPIIAQLAMEMLSVILNPFLFTVVLPYRAEIIVEFISRNSVQVPELGWICSFSHFDTGNKNFAGSVEQEDKLRRSICSFHRSVTEHASDPSLIDFGREHSDSPMIESAMSPRAFSPLVRHDLNESEIMNEFAGIEAIDENGEPFNL